ncbi:MAG: hypothetical protein N3G21_02055 [Candidatus Hydrogenedentes bacterium]|nr:hypothetical protein [Candidatus Hydrogenedentota bacterium]
MYLVSLFFILGESVFFSSDKASLIAENGSVSEASCDLRDEEDESEISNWFWFISAVNPYPKMESEKPIRKYFDPIMGFLSPDHEPVKTVGDYRDKHLIWAPHIGIGYKINEKFTVTVQGGGEGGKIRTKQTHPSILLFPLHTDFEIKRTAFYLGGGVHYSPFGSPVHKEFNNFWERIRSSRPYLSLSITHTYATYDARVKVKFEPVFPIVDLELSDKWPTLSVDMNLGLEIPLKKMDEFVVSVGYSKFLHLEEDFDSFTITLEYKRFFKKKSGNSSR